MVCFAYSPRWVGCRLGSIQYTSYIWCSSLVSIYSLVLSMYSYCYLYSYDMSIDSLYKTLLLVPLNSSLSGLLIKRWREWACLMDSCYYYLLYIVCLYVGCSGGRDSIL